MNHSQHTPSSTNKSPASEPGRWLDVPALVRFMAAHALLGFAMAGLFVCGLIITNPNNLGQLLLHALGSPWPAFLLWFFIGLTFASAQMGIAVMTLPPKDEPSPPSGKAIGRILDRFRVPSGLMSPVAAVKG